MNHSTKDFIARELVILGCLAASWFVANVALTNFGLVRFFGTFASFFQGVLLLYGFRWVWWGFQHARSREHLRGFVCRAVHVTGVIVALSGLALAIGPLISGQLTVPHIVIRSGLLVSGVALLIWNRHETERLYHPNATHSSRSADAQPPGNR